MKKCATCWIVCVAVWMGAAGEMTRGKPPVAPPRPTAGKVPRPAEPGQAERGLTEDAPLVRWLLEQDGGPKAPALPLAQVWQAASGKTLLSVDRTHPVDAAMIKRLGDTLDTVLPLMNRPDSAARTAAGVEQVAAAFEAALAGKLGAAPEVLGGATEMAGGAKRSGGSYPAGRIVDRASGRSYYFGVTLYATGEREGPGRAVRFDPREAADVITEEGAGWLVAVEFNGKTGKDAAFLNWELIDLATLTVRAAVIFQAGQEAVHGPSMILNDGRKGRD